MAMVSRSAPSERTLTTRNCRGGDRCCRSHDPELDAATLRETIAKYNEEDCRSTRKLQGWYQESEQ